MARALSTPSFVLFGCLLACSTDPLVTEDTGITFMPPDAAPDAPDAEDSSPPVSELTVGAPCLSDGDCPTEAPVCFLGDGFRDGHCTQFCAESPDVCPDGSHCTPIAFMTDVCLADCDHRASNPCRLGYGCGEGAPDASVCAPGCDVDEDCPSGLLCNPDDGGLGEGECFDPEAELGDPCVEPEDCDADSWCIRERDRGYPHGTCTIFRCDETANTGCPGDAQCVFDFYRDPICLDGCSEDGDCRSGYACEADPTYPERMRCTPRCDADSDCAEALFRCDTETGRCVA